MAIITASPSSSAAAMLHRDQHQIRAQFLNSLGIVREAPASEEAETSTDISPVKPLHHPEEGQAQVRFASDCSMVSIREIPSHRDYSVDDKQAIWSGKKEVAAIVQRNTVEYRAEGWNWEGVLEEDSFVVLPNGELMHPATHEHRLRLAQQQKQRLKAEKRRKQGYGYKSISDCLSFSPPKPVTRKRSKPSAKRVLRSVANE